MDETFQQSGKQDSFRHLLKSSASIWEMLGSQFFRTTTEWNQGSSEVDLGLVKLVWMTNVFFNYHQHKTEIKWLICVK